VLDASGLAVGVDHLQQERQDVIETRGSSVADEPGDGVAPAETLRALDIGGGRLAT
jgi:hypothetical protein